MRREQARSLPARQTDLSSHTAPALDRADLPADCLGESDRDRSLPEDRHRPYDACHLVDQGNRHDILREVRDDIDALARKIQRMAGKQITIPAEQE